MKKIFIVLLILSLTELVHAESYYSDYGDYSEYSLEQANASDIIDVDMERRYRLYNIIKTYGDYVYRATEAYPYLDENDYKVIKSEWQDEKPLEREGSIIEEMKDYFVSSIYFVYPYGSDNKFIMTEVEIFDGDNKLDIRSHSAGYSSFEFYKYMQNGIYEEENLYLKNNIGHYRATFDDSYRISKLKINLYLYDEGTELKKITFRYTSNPVIYAYTDDALDISYVLDFTNQSIDEISIPHEFNAFDDKGVIDDHIKTADYVMIYRYVDYLYHAYKLDYEYSDTYAVSPSVLYPFMDLDDYEDYYRYRMRDKITISDELIVDNYEDDLNAFILESTSDVQIESNIDYTKNGIYDITFVTPFKTINQKVEVNILENTYNELLLEYEKLLEEIEANNLLISDLENSLSEKKLELEEYEDINAEMNDENIYLKDELNKYIEKLESETSQIEELQKEIKELVNTNKQNIKEKDKLEVKYNKLTDKYNSLLEEKKKLVDTNKQLQKDYNKAVKENNKLLEYKELYENTKKDLLQSNKDIINYTETISKQENLNRELILENENKINNLLNDYQNILLDNEHNFEEIISEKDNYISELISLNDELNRRIVKQNENINYLEQINSENNQKYNEEIELLNYKLDEVDSVKRDISDNYYMCLNDKENMINKQDNINHKKNYLFYIIIGISLVINAFSLKQVLK